MLRACLSATGDDDELARLLQILFIDQRVGLRKTLKPREKSSAAQFFKAYLLRQRLYLHLKKVMPNLAEVVDYYS